MYNEYLNGMSDLWRRISVILMGFAYLFCLGLFFFVLAMPFMRAPKSWLAYGALVILSGVLWYGTGRFFLMLYYNKKSSNQVTMVPTWVVRLTCLVCAIPGLVWPFFGGPRFLIPASIGLVITMLKIEPMLQEKRMTGSEGQEENPLPTHQHS